MKSTIQIQKNKWTRAKSNILMMDHIFVSTSVAISTDKCKNDLMPVFYFRSHVFIANWFKFHNRVSFCQPKSQSSWYNIGKITVFIRDPLIPLCAEITIKSFIRKNFIYEFIPLISLDVILPRLSLKTSSSTWISIRTSGSSLRPEYNFRLISLYTRSQKVCKWSLKESLFGCDIGSNRITGKLFPSHGLHNFVKFLTVPFKMNFNHVSRFVDLCYLNWINILIRNLYFLAFLRLNLGEFVNKSLRSLILPLCLVDRHFWKLALFAYLINCACQVSNLGA